MNGSERQLRFAALGLSLALYAFVVVRSAWLCDDAYITYRTVDNFLSGLGLRWNPAERVQAYTHPLWMFVISAGTALSGNVYWTALATSLACSVAAVATLAFRLALTPWSAAVAVLTLAASSAFVDYSTSGLENPLTHLLLVVFLVRFLGHPLDGRNLGALALIASLAAVNRPDSVLLYLPALVGALLRFGHWRGLAIVAAGFAPLLAWEVFSLVYYGFPFPNTAYAKLKLFLPRGELVAQGLRYVAHSLRSDPVTVVALVAGGVFALLARSRDGLLVWAGAALTVAYVVFVGGDFMAGRLLAAPLLASVVLLARDAALGRPRGALAAVACVGVLALATPRPGDGRAMPYEDLIGPHGITDERRYYESFTGLRHYALHGGVPDHPWMAEGEAARRAGRKLALKEANGFFGYAAGPGVHVVDPYGLSEPFLARLPPPALPDWRIGHVWRELPEGYWETLREGVPRIVDPGLAEYRAALVEITRGELFARSRWSAIWGMALGRYESLLPVQALRYPPTTLREARALGGEELALDWRGLDVRFGEVVQAREVELRAPGDDGYGLVFFRGEQDVARAKRAPGTGVSPEPAVFRIAVPRRARREGFDRIRVQPYGGDGRYGLVDVTLR